MEFSSVFIREDLLKQFESIVNIRRERINEPPNVKELQTFKEIIDGFILELMSTQKIMKSKMDKILNESIGKYLVENTENTIKESLLATQRKIEPIGKNILQKNEMVFNKQNNRTKADISSKKNTINTKRLEKKPTILKLVNHPEWEKFNRFFKSIPRRYEVENCFSVLEEGKYY